MWNICQNTDHISDDSYFEELMPECNEPEINEYIDFTNPIHKTFFKYVWLDVEGIGEKFDE